MNQIPIFVVEASLPPICGGLFLCDVKVLEDPRLGVAIRYQAENVHADTFLYDLGLPDIPMDLRSSDVHEWFQKAWQDILLVSEREHYRDFQPLAFQFLHLPPEAPEPFCLWAAFSYRSVVDPQASSAGRTVSHLTLRTDLGFINKVRYSYSEDEQLKEAQFHAFLFFLLEWTAAVQEFSHSTVA